MRVWSLVAALPLLLVASRGDEVPASHPDTVLDQQPPNHHHTPDHAHEQTHVVMERMLSALPSHFQRRPQTRVSPLQSHELVFAVRVRNMDMLKREVLLRATPPAAAPPSPDQIEGQEEGREDDVDGLYQRWFSYDEVTAFTAVKDSAQAVLTWLDGLADEAGTGAVLVTHVSPRHDYIRVTAPVGLWETHLRTAFAAYEHDTSSLSSQSPSTSVQGDARGGRVHAEEATSESMSWPSPPSPSLVLRAENYSLPTAVAEHVETVFNTVQVPLRSRRARKHRHLTDAADHVAPNMDGDGDGYGEIVYEPASREPQQGRGLGQEDLQGDITGAREVHIDGVSVAPGVSAQLRVVEQPDQREREEQGGEGDADSLFTGVADTRPSIRPTRSLRPNHSRSPARSRRPMVAPSTLSSSRVAPRPSRRPSPRPAAQVSTADSAPVDVTIPFLRSLYHIPNPPSNPRSASAARVRGANVWRQAVFETNNEKFSNADLSVFQRTNALPQQPAVAVGGFETDTCSLSGTGSGCFEGNLDVQFISGTTAGRGVTTEVWHVDADTGDPFLNWILAAAQDPSPPAVTSISWGNDERYTSPSVMAAFEREAVKLAAIGVTILVSSGDNGVAGYDCKKGACDQDSSADGSYWSKGKGSGWTGTGFFPKFPASCPWVTVVGATSGPERYANNSSRDAEGNVVCSLTISLPLSLPSNFPHPCYRPCHSGHVEVAASSTAGDVITTGGGFSGYWSTPAWQTGAVTSYTAQADASSGAGFNRRGRGYPDVALIGVGYQVVVQGQMYSMYGTSASTPVFAGMITLVNVQRARKGRGPVGLLNPTLYARQNAARFVDITSGSNNCCSSMQPAAAICCAHGFAATAGWDPLTGQGTVSYPALLDMFT